MHDESAVQYVSMSAQQPLDAKEVNGHCWQLSHCRSLVVVPTAVSKVPAAHSVCSAQIVSVLLCAWQPPELNVPSSQPEHLVQTLLEYGVHPTDSYSPSAQASAQMSHFFTPSPVSELKVPVPHTDAHTFASGSKKRPGVQTQVGGAKLKVPSCVHVRDIAWLPVNGAIKKLLSLSHE
jgi:hypothetical protein